MCDIYQNVYIATFVKEKKTNQQSKTKKVECLDILLNNWEMVVIICSIYRIACVDSMKCNTTNLETAIIEKKKTVATN